MNLAILLLVLPAQAGPMSHTRRVAYNPRPPWPPAPRSLAGLCFRHMLLQELGQDPHILCAEFKEAVVQKLRSIGAVAEVSEHGDALVLAAEQEFWKMSNAKLEYMSHYRGWANTCRHFRRSAPY